MKKISTILILISFILSNSNLFFYQHYCGDELFGSSFFHTVTCECGDELNNNSLNNWIVSKDDGCCKEILIFAHIQHDFNFTTFILKVFFTLLLTIVFFSSHILHKILLDYSSYFYKVLKRFLHSAIYLFLLHLTKSTVVLRN